MSAGRADYGGSPDSYLGDGVMSALARFSAFALLNILLSGVGLRLGRRRWRWRGAAPNDDGAPIIDGEGNNGDAPADDGGGAGDDVSDFAAADVTAEFPDEGDSLVMLEEAETGRYGRLRGGRSIRTRGEVGLTSFTITSDEATLNATLDDESRPTELQIGTQTITADYNADGTVDYEL